MSSKAHAGVVVHVGVRPAIHHVLVHLGGGGQALRLVGDRLPYDDQGFSPALLRRRLDVTVDAEVPRSFGSRERSGGRRVEKG